MKIPVFVSVSSPINEQQVDFLRRIHESLEANGFQPRTLGETDYDVMAPLAGCRRLMLECNGLITIAFRRNKIEKAIVYKPGKDKALDGKWTTSSFCHIETSMAYQLGLPILIFREKGVIEEGVLEAGVVGQYMPTFDLDDNRNTDEYFDSVEYKDLIRKWGYNVYTVWDKKGRIERY